MAPKNKPQLENMQDQLCIIEKKLDILASFEIKIEEIKTSMTFFNEKFEEQKIKLEDLFTENKLLKDNQAKLEQTVAILQTKMNDIVQKQEDINVSSRRKSLEICGIPKKPQENIQDMVNNIAEKLDLTAPDLEESYRIHSKNTKIAEPIVIRFNTRKERDMFKSAAKKKRLTTSDINTNGSGTPIYVNEHLTPTKKRLLGKVISIKKDLRAKFVWTSHGNIYFRKNDDSIIIKVNSEDDLVKLK